MHGALFFFLTQNHREWYKVSECSYTLAASFSQKILITSSKRPGGIGRFLSAQGTCSITGILTGAKYSS